MKEAIRKRVKGGGKIGREEKDNNGDKHCRLQFLPRC